MDDHPSDAMNTQLPAEVVDGPVPLLVEVSRPEVAAGVRLGDSASEETVEVHAPARLQVEPYGPGALARDRARDARVQSMTLRGLILLGDLVVAACGDARRGGVLVLRFELQSAPSLYSTSDILVVQVLTVTCDTPELKSMT